MTKTRPGKSTKAAPGQAANRRGGRPPNRKAAPPIAPRPKPWGLIAACVVVVVFAAGVLTYALTRDDGGNAADDANAAQQSEQDDLAEAQKTDGQANLDDAHNIEGITVKDFPSRNHTSDPITYDEIPPFGGDHDPEWADCTGTVYSNPIRDENAVHTLEHGSIWITYQPGLPAADVQKLTDRVEGNTYMLMSPYPGLSSPVSLQAWGHQLAVDSVDDPRIDQFINDLRLNPANTPEFGATCVNPQFKDNPRPPDQVVPIDPAG